jgi:hypothetical protein
MRSYALTWLAVASGCSGVPDDLGLNEPIRVLGGTFVQGALPGLPPDDTAPRTTPAITLIESANGVVHLGQAAKKIDGRASIDAVAVALGFESLGTGYWVSPVGPPDPAAGYEYTWSLDTSIGWDLPLGPGAIDVVAIDRDGVAGRRSKLAVCVRPDLLDNLATCDPSLAPPDTVLALAWDTDVDLDLVVRTPSDKLVGPSHPSTVAHEPVTSADLAAPHVGVLDRDSNAGCQIDGIGREALVWQTPPEPGTYLVYADLADACGQPSVRFTATLYRAQLSGDGTSRLVEVHHQDGRLLKAAADGGRGPGLFLLQLAL